MARPLICAIDQGTTGTTVLLLDAHDAIVGRGYREIPQSYPRPGWVEHDPESIWLSVRQALAEAQENARTAGPFTIAAIGITNQRETVVLWERATGAPVAPAIVWQDRRTTAACEIWQRGGHEPRLQELTGLLIDPYFSASKVAWLLENVPNARARAGRGELAFGTIESYLMFRLSGGHAHVSDTSNAARTQLLDIHTLDWSEELLEFFAVPRALLPVLRPCAGPLAETRGVPELPDGTPITGSAGDQQAALFGQGCVNPGEAKCTYGTGSFLLMNAGPQPPRSRNRLLTTVAWALPDTAAAYALEGGAFICGALVQWLRDGLGIIESAAEVEALARAVPDAGGVIIVPAFTGLGAPHWRADARGLISGLTRGTTRAHLARAALEAMALQNVDIVRAMEADAGQPLLSLRVDGGAAANDLLLQIQADLLGVPVERPAMLETTALGAARLAAVGAGLRPFPGLPQNAAAAAVASGIRRFLPRMPPAERDAVLEGWRQALAKA